MNTLEMTSCDLRALARLVDERSAASDPWREAVRFRYVKRFVASVA